ncbi:kynureninase [Aquibacillus halophilus]|uniref:Kynureninase n=1 Tax=Aquibacillus halophilus TaxID=930132 RepID=A0A6A8DAU6_9BACI|nr:kynureninase [Aquibacillus halophilus]MRH42738.1 kynureninase [Aquibacillus halophilus]
MNDTNIYSLEYAKTLDKQDELHAYRDEFYTKEGVIYFDGNSLGLLSKRAEKSVKMVMNAWKDNAIEAWTQTDNPWYYLSESLGEKMAPLVGANAKEVVVTGSTTVNLHQLVATFYKPQESRTKILADELNFPSDIYALKSQLQLKGYSANDHLIQVKSRDGHTINEEDIIAAMTDEIAIIVLPSVLYRSGQILDMERLTDAAHKHGIIIGFDLCHSIGAIPHKLDEWGVDFAFWCNYKHLNAGPGSLGGLYVNEKHFGENPGLAGWFSSDKEKQFDMKHELIPATDAGAFQIGTPHVLSAAPLIGSLEMFREAGIERIRTKSLKLTDYLLNLISKELQGYGFVVGTPLSEEQRGAHVFIEHEEAARICKALKADGVIPDFRAPNGIRLAPVALYNSFEEIFITITKLKKIMDDKRYKNYSNNRGVVA